MVYVTGDMHGDFSRFTKTEVKKLKKGDTLIVCGDFGFVWNGSKQEKKRLDKIGSKKYNVLFVPGCHDNYELLEGYEESDWNGGRVRVISGNLRMLCRGSVFEIEGHSVFAFGGGTSDDTSMREQQNCWWEEEQPTQEEIELAVKNLAGRKNKVDVVITHDVPTSIADFLKMQELSETSFINAFLERVNQAVDFSKWFFGKYHEDKVISSKFKAVYLKLTPLEEKKG